MRSFDPTDPGASYRVRITFANGDECMLGPWEKLGTAKSIRTRKVNDSRAYPRPASHTIGSAVIERATGWKEVPE